MATIMQTALNSGGVEARGSKVYILMRDRTPMSQAKLIARGVKKMGGFPVEGNLDLETEKQIQRIKESRPTMVMGSAFKIYRLTQEGRLSHDLTKTGAKIIFITSYAYV